jgi:hypothetical protein
MRTPSKPRCAKPSKKWASSAVSSNRSAPGIATTPSPAIVGLVEPGFELNLDPREVAGVFEAPLDFLMNPANHEVREAQWQGRARYYYVMPWEGHNIWGATAGMVRALYERLYL